LVLICMLVQFSNGRERKNTDMSAKLLFAQFMKQYNKTYLSEIERVDRFVVFQKNLEVIKKQNDNSKSAKFAVNKFADLTQEEFRSLYLQTPYPATGLARSCSQYGLRPPFFSERELSSVPDSWDWRTTGGKDNKGIVTPVKDQGQCGSCWTFSTTGNIEGLWALKGNSLTSFSEQLIVDCSKACCNMPGYDQPICNAGCNGGFQWSAFYDIVNWGGLQTEADYPYTGEDGQCNKNNTKLMAPIQNYTCVSSTTAPADEEAMRAYIQKNGPVSIAMNAGLLQFYFGGIVDPFWPWFECYPDSLDHALLIVGWGQERNWIGEMTPYWIVKNSWASDWGEGGYFLIARNKNLCGLATAVSAGNM